MKTRAALLILISAGAVLLTVYLVKPAPEPKPDPVPAKPSTTAAKPASPPKAGDVLMLSPSVRDGARLYAGWPLIIDLAVWRPLPDETSQVTSPVTIKAKGASWGSALVVTVKDSSGTAVKWPLHLEKVEEASVTVGQQDMADASWWLAPEETKSLPEGQYSISVAFDPRLLVGDPPPSRSDNYYLTVAKEPAQLDKDLQEEKDLAFASFHLVRGETAAAGALTGKVLAANPESIGGHRLNGRLLFMSGKTNEALTAYGEALDIYYRKYPEACPPWPMLAERDAVLGQIEIKTAPGQQ